MHAPIRPFTAYSSHLKLEAHGPLIVVLWVFVVLGHIRLVAARIRILLARLPWEPCARELASQACKKGRTEGGWSLRRK